MHPMAAISPTLNLETEEPTFGYFAYDFMTRDYWIFGHAPIIIHEMQIGVANSTIINFN